MIFGTSPQQNWKQCYDWLTKYASLFQVNLYLTKPQGGRYPGIEPDELAMFEWNTDVIYTYSDVTEVIDEVISKDANSTGVILSLGSLYLQGNILNHLGITSDNDLSLLPKQ